MYTRIHTVPKTTDIYNKEELSEQLTRKTWQSITALRLANHVFSMILFSIIRNLCNLYRIIYGRLPQWIPILSYSFIIHLFLSIYSFVLSYLFNFGGGGWWWVGWGVVGGWWWVVGVGLMLWSRWSVHMVPTRKSPLFTPRYTFGWIF